MTQELSHITLLETEEVAENNAPSSKHGLMTITRRALILIATAAIAAGAFAIMPKSVSLFKADSINDEVELGCDTTTTTPPPVDLSSVGYTYIGAGICRFLCDRGAPCGCFPPWKWWDNVTAADAVDKCDCDPRCVGFAVDSYSAQLYYSEPIEGSLAGTCGATTVNWADATCVPTWNCYSKDYTFFTRKE